MAKELKEKLRRLHLEITEEAKNLGDLRLSEEMKQYHKMHPGASTREKVFHSRIDYLNHLGINRSSYE